METFSLYLLKSAVWVSGFGLVYFLFLRNERFFHLKRLYLVTGILVSFLFPLITIHYTVEVPAPEFVPVETSSQFSFQPVPAETSSLSRAEIIAGLYLAGFIFLLVRMLIQYRHVLSTIKKSEIMDLGSFKLIRSSEYPSSFSFFNYVFVSNSVNDKEVKEIINHELAHVNQKHWFDLLLGEIMRLVQWANPFAWIYTGFIRLNHEYLADATALLKASDPAMYKAALLNQVFKSPVISLSNSFNFSVTNTRFDMMKKVITSPYRKLKVLFIIPVFAITFYAFAMPEYTYLPVSSEPVAEIIQNLSEKVQVIRGEVLKKDGTPIAGATITVSGTSNGAITGTDGRFVLSNVPDSADIVVSCKGFITETVKVDSHELVIHMTEEIVVVGYAKPEPSAKDTGIKFRNIENLQLKPILILDGNEIDREKLGKFDPKSISTISVLKNQSAIAVYGDKGKDGVIIITTKKKDQNETKEEPENQDGPGSQSHPLIIIDDMLTDRTNLDGIDPDMIESISILKDSPKYGEKGKNGVVLIRLKPGVQLEKKDSTGISNVMPVNPGEARTFNVPRTIEKAYFSGSSRNNILKFIAENTRYPAGARNSLTDGKVKIIVKVAKGGIVRESRLAAAKEEIKVPSLPEVVIVGYTSAGPDELRPNDNAPVAKAFELLEKESLRVANLLGNANVPEWKDRDMEFAVAINFVLR